MRNYVFYYTGLTKKGNWKPHPVLILIFQSPIIAINLLSQISSSQILNNEAYLNTFQPQQPAALSLQTLNLQVQGYAIGLLFFVVYFMLINCVVLKLQMERELIGILYFLFGAGFLINNFTMFLSGRFTNSLFSYIAITVFVGEIPFCLWLYI